MNNSRRTPGNRARVKKKIGNSANQEKRLQRPKKKKNTKKGIAFFTQLSCGKNMNYVKGSVNGCARKLKTLPSNK